MDNTPAPPPPPHQPGPPQPPAEPPQQIAVWYFIAATFIFTLPNLLYPDMPLWLRILFVVIGILIVAAGGAQFAKEIHGRRQNPPSAPPMA